MAKKIILILEIGEKITTPDGQSRIIDHSQKGDKIEIIFESETGHVWTIEAEQSPSIDCVSALLGKVAEIIKKLEKKGDEIGDDIKKRISQVKGMGVITRIGSAIRILKGE